ncbi:conserved protein, unknown function [Hepatocystis sp. ex Piliocolobus tephrosceles]|nr:conserved protein, unknown function [Hepatocystis sp. ex Piliocolobus tephrosceles]
MKITVLFLFVVILFVKESINVNISTTNTTMFDINNVLKDRIVKLYRKGNKLNNYFFSYIEKNSKKNKCYKYIQEALNNSNTQIMKSEIIKCLDTSKNVLNKTFQDVLNKLFLYIKNVFIKKYFIFFLIYLINLNTDKLVSKINDPYILNDYKLKENASPAMFNLKYSELEIPTSNNVINGWFINSNKKSNKIFLLLHGYNSNRQACLFFLNILKKLNVHNDTNIFIPDMQHFNEKGVVDIYNILKYFKDHMQINEVNIYTQSSTNLLVLLLSKNYKNKIVSKGKQNFIGNIMSPTNNNQQPKNNEIDNIIYIDKYIFDSPILNLPKTISIHFHLNDLKKKLREEKMKLHMYNNLKTKYDQKTLFNYFLSFFIWLLNNQLKGRLYDYDFNKLITENNINPSNIYILHSLNDNISLLNILAQEVKLKNLVPMKNIFIFKNGQHANIYEKSKNEYNLIVKKIIKGFGILDFLYYIPLKSKMTSINT